MLCPIRHSPLALSPEAPKSGARPAAPRATGSSRETTEPPLSGHASWSWPRRLGFSGWRAGAVSACRIGSAGIRATLLAALLLLTSIERVVDLDGAGLSIIF